ncbi:MAG: AMP-binding protein [Actinomycetia bacterium]|nr:AMP-binding protein [Actinomycetes bacterium]
MTSTRSKARWSLDALERSDKTFKDIYSIIFSYSDSFAYERLIDYEISAVTYEAHDADIRAFAAYLEYTYPDAAGGYVAIDLPNTPNFLVAFWGVLMSGRRPYLVNSFYPCELRVSLLERLDIQLVISNAACYPDFTVIDIDAYDRTCPPVAGDRWCDELALSSTMTGLEAKICVFDGEAVVNQILNTRGILRENSWFVNDYEGRVKIAMILPLFHIFGLMVGYFWFAAIGATLVFYQDNSPETIRRTIIRHKVTHIFAPPILFHELHKAIMSGVARETEKRRKKFQRGLKLAFALQNVMPSAGLKISRWLFKDVLAAAFGASPQIMISGGAHIDNEALRTINSIGYPLLNGYGTTETAISGVNLAKRIGLRTNGSVGAPFAGASYTLKEDATLVVASNSICKQIITLHDARSGFSCIETNDLAALRDGQYLIIGRKSDLFIGQGGENISPDSIENELQAKNATRLCVTEIGGKLAIVLEYGEKLPAAIIAHDIDQIKRSLARIAYGQYVSEIFVTRQAISAPNAIKVSRALLKRRIEQGAVVLCDYRELVSARGARGAQGDDTGEDTSDDTMRAILQAFAHALGATETEAEITPSSDFFIDLGGTSLDYVALICELESAFNLRIDFEKDQDLRSPERICQYVRAALL